MKLFINGKDSCEDNTDKQTIDVDTISGATYSSTGIKNAVGTGIRRSS